ncbi:glycosyltransferase family 39 protein [Streptomyces sp. E11-3]|uniref:glycosyltransferase family 39 protein n=1 Tax=Streptomyces sp. E11-3 TaxID=3110112 RepID=UPI00397EA744
MTAYYSPAGRPAEPSGPSGEGYGRPPGGPYDPYAGPPAGPYDPYAGQPAGPPAAPYAPPAGPPAGPYEPHAGQPVGQPAGPTGGPYAPPAGPASGSPAEPYDPYVGQPVGQPVGPPPGQPQTADAPGSGSPETGTPGSGTPGGRADRRRAAAGGSASTNRASALLVFVLPALATLACVLPGIGDRQLWRDEHATWWASTLSFGDLGRLIEQIDVVFTPYYALMHLWIMVAGDSPTALRLPGAVAMAVSAGLVGLIGRRMFAVRTGLLAGLLFAVVPTVTRYGQEARPYAFATLFALLATLLLLRALDKPSLKGWTLYALAIAGAGFGHLVAMSVLAGHLGLVVLEKRRGDRIVHYAFAGAALLGVSITLPMIAQGSGQSGQIAWNVTTNEDLVAYPEELFGSLVTGGVVMGLGLAGLLVARRYALLLAAWAILPPALTFLTANQLHLFLPRYLLFTLPAWALLTSALVTRLAGRLVPGTPRGAGAQAFGGLLVAAAAAAYTFVALPAIDLAKKDLDDEPDFAAAARTLAQGQRPGDGMIFNGGLSERRAMAYELRDRAAPKDVLMQWTPQQNGSYGASECKRPANCLADADRLWLVSTVRDKKPLDGMDKKAAAVLDKDFETTRTVKLHRVTVQVLERK